MVWLHDERQATLLGTVKMKFQGCFKWLTTCIVIQSAAVLIWELSPNAAPATTMN